MLKNEYKKKMIPLTNKLYESYFNQTSFHICKKSLHINTLMIQTIVKLGTIAITLVNLAKLHITYVA